MKFLVFILLIFVLMACEEEKTSKYICGLAETKFCDCDNGTIGKQTCQDNKWGECVCGVQEECEGITCSGNGECIVTGSTPSCECDDGYYNEGLNCIKDGTEDPCKEHTCITNSHCVVEDDLAKCVCDESYIESNATCLFDCSYLDNSQANEDNNGCECKRGYHLDAENCVQDEDFECLDYECSDLNSHCSIDTINGVDTPNCVCNLGFVDKNGVCTLDCSSIDNSTPNSDNTDCICKDDFHFESGLCVSNTKTVNCSDIIVPTNAHQINIDISVSWTQEDGWEIPIDCVWECDDEYQDKDGNETCLPACISTSCENGSCDDSTGFLDCTCDAGYQDNDNNETCLPNCESTSVNGVECGGYGTCYDDTGVVTCLCEDDYQDNDNDGICKESCHVDILRPELSTCGKYGTCSDGSGEILCACNDGYFVSPTTNKCIAPCEDIDCGRHGRCEAIGLESMSCDCDSGYQDNDGDLVCIKSCDSSCLENSSSCNDSTGALVCQCDVGYQDNDMDGTCLLDCTNTLCNGTKQVLNSCDDITGFPVCDYENGYNYTNIVGGTNNQVVNDSVVDSNGNLYFIGAFKGTVDFDFTDGFDTRVSSGEEDIFITRINSDGSYAWTYSIGAGNNDSAESIVIDAYNNLYITGYFTSTVDFDPVSGSNFYSPMRSEGYRDIFILKLSSNGIYDWAKSFGSIENDYPTSINLDSSSVYLTGYFEDNIDFDRTGNGGEFSVKGRRDGFVASFDIVDGNYLWAKTFGDTGKYNRTDDVLVFNDSLYITGQMNGDVDFNYGGETQEFLSTVSYQAYILKISKDGIFTWVKELKSQSDNDVSRGMSLREINNEIYLFGFLSGNVDFDTDDIAVDILNGGSENSIFVSKLNEEGSIESRAVFISYQGNSTINDVTNYNGNIYIVGRFEGSLNFEGNIITNTGSDTNYGDAFFVRLDSNLTVSDLFSFGGNLDDSANTISITSLGAVYVLGTFEDSVDFDTSSGTNTKSSLELKDIFISRFTE